MGEAPVVPCARFGAYGNNVYLCIVMATYDNTHTPAPAGGPSGVKLEVMVAVYGRSAIERVSGEGRLEKCPGVRYLLSWQKGDDVSAEVPDALLRRDDVVVRILDGKGVSLNRNNLLSMATAPYLLCADDDIVYRADSLKAVIRAMDERPDVDLAVFRCDSAETRRYPAGERDLTYKPWCRAFYPYLVEIAMRRDSIERAGLRFDERFGTNAGFLGAGEEDVFCFMAWKLGLRLRFVPITILALDGNTTRVRLGARPEVIRARGAVLRVVYGRLSALRMVRLAVSLSGALSLPYRHVYGLLRQGARYVSHQRG